MAKHNEWMSVSDLMTGLMVIFLFITVAYMKRVKENQNVLNNYVETRNQLYEELKDKFQVELNNRDLALGNDLSMKFNNASSLFESGKSELTKEFKQKLDVFLPKYLDILLNSEFSDEIMEIRIEGHTDPNKFDALDKDPYIANVILSQRRALDVLKYLRKLPMYEELDSVKKNKLNFWFTANGFSYGKSLDSGGEYTYVSKNKIDNDKSRRVEFRIITRGDDILIDFVNKNK